MKSPFSSSSPDNVTAITATDVVPADNAKTPAKDDSQEEAADGTAGATLSSRRTEEVIIIYISQQISITAIED